MGGARVLGVWRVGGVSVCRGVVGDGVVVHCAGAGAGADAALNVGLDHSGDVCGILHRGRARLGAAVDAL